MNFNLNQDVVEELQKRSVFQRSFCSSSTTWRRGAVHPSGTYLSPIEPLSVQESPTRSFAANALYLEILRLAYNLVTAFQRNCLDTSWQNLTLSTLRYKLFLLPGELIRPQNRPVLRLRQSSLLQHLADDILRKIKRVRPLRS